LSAELDILPDDLGRRFAFDQPGRPLESVLDVLRPGREHINMIIGEIADGMTLFIKLLEQIHVLLVKDLACNEEMHHATVGFDPSRRVEDIPLRLLVEVSFLVVPMSVLPLGEIAGHLEIEGDGDERFFAWNQLLGWSGASDSRSREGGG